MAFIVFKLEHFAVDQHTLCAKGLTEELFFKLTQVPLPALWISPYRYGIQHLFTGFEAKIRLLGCPILESN